MNSIRLELNGLTAEQAHHIIEAYREAQGFTSVTHARAAQPVSSPAAQAPAKPASNGNSAHDDDAAPLASHDIRNVPYHKDFHAPRFNADGSWARRRGHDKDACAVYEAPYLANPQGAASAISQGVNMANTAAPELAAPQPVPAAQAPAEAAPQPVVVEPAPTVEAYRDMWVDLCREFKVTGEHQAYIEATFGGHPCSETVLFDATKRAAIWTLFHAWAAGEKL